MSEKPVIFISHSSDDEELAHLIGQQIENACDNQVKAFVARYSIPAGETWRDDILQNLKAAQVLIVLVSESSSRSRWVGFEIGYLWPRISRKGKEKLPVYPLCLPGNTVFSPLDGIQGKSLDNFEELVGVFEKICTQVGGDIGKINVEVIVDKVKGNPEIELSEIDIKAILSDFMKQYKSETWILYLELDQQLSLPQGSAKNFLKSVAEDKGRIVEQETETGISFKSRPVKVSVGYSRYA